MQTMRRTLLFVLIFILPLAVRAQTGALAFVAVTPCRVVDTRLPDGPFGGPPIQGQGSRNFAIPSGSCGIPNTALAYSLNVTVVPQGFLGYLTVWPTGQQQPFVSTMNSYDGRTKANAAIVAAGVGEAISVFATNTTDVVLDIDGYFVSATDLSTLDFFPLTPCRVVDTRGAPGDLGGPSLMGGVPRTFPILEATSCNIPSTAQAYSLNFTAVPSGPLGYLTVWPTGQNQPLVSTLNAPTGTVTANAAIVPAGAGGAVTTFPYNDTDLVIDINGYFAPQSPSGSPLYVLPPCRVLDTRQTTGAFSGALGLDVAASPCGAPNVAHAFVLNATVLPTEGYLDYLTLWPDGQRQPLVSTLNARDGAVTSNLAIVPTTNGAIDAYASNTTQLVVDIFSYFASIEPVIISPPTLPGGSQNAPYSVQLQAVDGFPPYTFSLQCCSLRRTFLPYEKGGLPPGLGLSSSGLISGTPTTQGDFPFTVLVMDSDEQITPQTFSINITPPNNNLTVVSLNLPAATQYVPYVYNGNPGPFQMLAFGGVGPPYRWSITGLPATLGYTTSGLVGGVQDPGDCPQASPGRYLPVAQATDSVGNTSLPTTVNLQILPPLQPVTITTTTLPPAPVNSPYSQPVVTSSGLQPYAFAITAGSLPDNFSLNMTTGVISSTLGPPIQDNGNTYIFTVTVVDSQCPHVPVQYSGGTYSQVLSITVPIVP